MTEKETIPGAFKALITGYGIVGFDYAYIPATSVPEFSLKGDKPFTIFTTVCFKNTQNGSILEQQDMFQMGIMDGLLYVAAIDWCAIKFSEYKVAGFVTDHWYSIAIVYDGKILSAWLEGEKKDSFKCKAPCKGKAEKELCIGKQLDAYPRHIQAGKVLDRWRNRHRLGKHRHCSDQYINNYIHPPIVKI